MSVFTGILFAIFADVYDLELEAFIVLMIGAIASAWALHRNIVKRNASVTLLSQRSHQIRRLTASDFNTAWAKAKKAVSGKHIKPRDKQVRVIFNKRS